MNKLPTPEITQMISSYLQAGGTFSMFGNPSVGYFTGGLFGTPTL